MSDLQLFTCDRLNARLTTGACARNWESVAGKKLHELVRLHQCAGCHVGAMNAGKPYVPAPLPRFCPRCLRPSPRLIGGRLCVSCQNREYELAKGRNARGTPVQKLRLYPIEITVSGETTRLNATSRIEVAMTALRRDVSVLVGWRGVVD